MTKSELIERAKELDIKGRWNMSTTELEAAIAAAEGSAPVEASEVAVPAETTDEVAAEESVALETEAAAAEAEVAETKVDEKAVAKVLAAAKKAAPVRAITRHERSMKPRGTDGKVIRKGKNLSGNAPFALKPYFVDIASGNRQGTVNYIAAPKQVRDIYDCMVGLDITSDENARLGREIVDLAKENGFLKSKIESAKLFAYYRRALDTLGLVLSEVEFD